MTEGQFIIIPRFVGTNSSSFHAPWRSPGFSGRCENRPRENMAKTAEKTAAIILLQRIPGSCIAISTRVLGRFLRMSLQILVLEKFWFRKVLVYLLFFDLYMQWSVQLINTVIFIPLQGLVQRWHLFIIFDDLRVFGQKSLQY